MTSMQKNKMDFSNIFQVVDLYKELRLSLTECIFSMAAQHPLNEADTLRLIAFLREDCKWNPDGTLEPASLCVLMTLLYCFDNRLLEHEDKEGLSIYNIQ